MAVATQACDDLLTMACIRAMPKPAWLIEGVLPQGALALLYGHERTFKSFTAQDIALCVAASGVPAWQGRAVARHGSVVYVAAEDASGCRKRVLAWEEAHALRLPNDSFHLFQRPMYFRDADDVQGFVARITPVQPVFVVFDTVSRCMSGLDENTEMHAAIEAGEAVRRATGAAVLFIHHKGKRGNSPRGDSKLPAACDTNIQVSRRSKALACTLSCDKQKNASEFDDFTLHFAEQSYSYEGEEDASLVLLAPDATPRKDGTTRRRGSGSAKAKRHRVLRPAVLAYVRAATATVWPKDVADALGCSAKDAWNHLNKLVGDGTVQHGQDGYQAASSPPSPPSPALPAA